MRIDINLLPLSIRRQQLTRRRAVQWSKVLCIVLLVGCLSHWYKLREHEALRQRLEVLSREHEPTRTMMRQLVKMRQDLTELQQQELIARELERQRNALALLGVISQTAQKTKGRLQVTTLKLTNFQSSSNVDGRSGPASEPAGLLLAGVSLDNPAVAELLDGLQDSGIFSRVELLTLTERTDGDVSLRDYELRCEF